MKRVAMGLAILLIVVLGTAPSFGRLAPWLNPSPGPLPVGLPPQNEEPRELKSAPTAQMLIATRQVRGPFFAESVVLLMQHDASGALGLILNRPTSARITELEPNPRSATSRNDRIYAGGPVEPRIVIYLVRTAEKPPESTTILQGIYATANPETLRLAMENEIPTQDFRAYAGYAGWAPGQLDAEIERGDWYLAPAAAEAIFDSSPGELWQKVVMEHEGVQVRRPPPAERKETTS